MPFDQFTIEQLAGALLPETRTLAQKIRDRLQPATIRTTPRRARELDRVPPAEAYVIDRVHTTANDVPRACSVQWRSATTTSDAPISAARVLRLLRLLQLTSIGRRTTATAATRSPRSPRPAPTTCARIARPRAPHQDRSRKRLDRAEPPPPTRAASGVGRRRRAIAIGRGWIAVAERSIRPELNGEARLRGLVRQERRLSILRDRADARGRDHLRASCVVARQCRPSSGAAARRVCPTRPAAAGRVGPRGTTGASSSAASKFRLASRRRTAATRPPQHRVRDPHPGPTSTRSRRTRTSTTSTAIEAGGHRRVRSSDGGDESRAAVAAAGGAAWSIAGDERKGSARRRGLIRSSRSSANEDVDPARHAHAQLVRTSSAALPQSAASAWSKHRRRLTRAARLLLPLQPSLGPLAARPVPRGERRRGVRRPSSTVEKDLRGAEGGGEVGARVEERSTTSRSWSRRSPRRANAGRQGAAKEEKGRL
jgi:hypothetical protein